MATRNRVASGDLIAIIGRFFQKPTRVILAAVLVCSCGSLHAQQDLEGSIPSNWTATAGTLSISPLHYKMGTESLRWDWTAGDVITVTLDPGVSLGNSNTDTCNFWVWNGSALSDEENDKLTVEFTTALAKTYRFIFYLDYTGWRRTLRHFHQDMGRPAGEKDTILSVRITAPSAGSGTFYFDAVDWVGADFERLRDAQNRTANEEGSMTFYSHAHSYAPTIALDPVSLERETQLNDLRERWLAVAKGASAPSAEARALAVSNTANGATDFTQMNIVEDANGIRGKVVGENAAGFGWALVLARDYAWHTSGTASDSGAKMDSLARHLLDQGLASNSNLIPTNPPGLNYNFRDLPTALILAGAVPENAPGPAYNETTRKELWEFLAWAYASGNAWHDDWYRNWDDIHLQSFQHLGAILFLIDDEKEVVRQLEGQKKYINRFLALSEGGEGGIKPDGTGFHHNAHYNGYMHALSSMVNNMVYLLRGTDFQISRAAYENLSLGFLTYINMSTQATNNTVGYYGNSLCGRHPFSTLTNISKSALLNLAIAGQVDFPESPFPELLAQAYNRRFPATGYGASPITASGTGIEPSGFFQYNYSPLGIYRRANWVASIRAPQRYFWSAEIWRNSNVYGRYQGYGALEILYSGNVSTRVPNDANGAPAQVTDPNDETKTIEKKVTVKSGQSIDGWDWSQPPGTTTIALPHEKLGNKKREDVRSQLKFSGALSFQDGQSGLYGANFQERKPAATGFPDHNPSFVWRKSWFCFDSQIVCLGSDISNQNAEHDTVTTLFQSVISYTRSIDENEEPVITRIPTILNGEAIRDFPYPVATTPELDELQPHWLLDEYGTGFIVQPELGNSLQISRINQISANHTGEGADTRDDFAKAWINHGKNPHEAAYEYVVLPGADENEMPAFVTAHATPATRPYKVLQRDSTAHVVKWKATGQIGYAIFTDEALLPETQTAGLLMSVERPCLVMTEITSTGDALVSLVDPDLNFTREQSDYGIPDFGVSRRGYGLTDASVARTLQFTVHGTWTLDNPGPGTSIIDSDVANTTTLRVTTQHGLATHVRLIPPPLPGAKAWVNLGTDWTDPANWGANWGGSPPADDPDTDIAVLGAVTVQPVLDGPYAVKGLTLDGGTTLSGSGNLTLGSGGVIATGTDNAFTLANITLHTGQTWDIGLGNLSVSSAIAGTAGTVLTKSGSGSLILSGTNTYSGGLTVAQGSVVLLGDQSAATGSIDQKASGTSLSIGNSTQTSPTQVVVASGNGIVIGETSLIGNADRNFAVTGSPDFATTVTNHGSLTVGRAALATVGPNASWFQHGPMNIIGVGGYSGSLEITDGGKFSYAGNSDIQLNPASENSGNALLTISNGGNFTTSAGFVFGSAGTGTGTGQIALTGQGTLQISANIAELFKGDPTGTVWLGDAIIDTNGFSTTIPLNLAGISGNPGSLCKTGTGTLTLSGTNIYTGPTTIAGGVLSTGLLANQSSPSGIGAAGSSASNLVIDGGTLQYTGPLLGGSGFWTRAFTIGANGAAIDLSTATGQLRINGGIAFSGNGPRTLTITTGSQGGRLNSALGDGNGGATSLVKNGSGTLLVTGANTYTGPLQILAGTVQYGFGNPDGGSSGTGHSVAISNGAALTFRHAGDNTVTYNAPISGEGSVTMNHNNSLAGGSLTLGGNNSFTGGLTINPTSSTHVLTLKAGGSSALGSGTLNIGQYGQLDLNGHSNATGLLTSSHNNAKVTNNGAADATLTLHGNTTQTFGGVIQDGASKLSIVKSGSGIQRLTGPNSHSGDTTVTGGTLSLSQPNPHNESSTVSLTAGAVLELAFTGTDTVDKLFINGVQQAAGDYTQSHSSGTLAGTGTLRVSSGPSGYDAWAAANAPGQTADLDHDSDGVQNGIEFFMGLSGSGFTANPAPDANGLITWPMAANDSGTYGTDYVVQTSTDLVAWSDVPQSGVTIVSGVSISYTVTGPGVKFVRLVVGRN